MTEAGSTDDQTPRLGGEPTDPASLLVYRRLVDDVLASLAERGEAPAHVVQELIGYIDVGGLWCEGRLVPASWLPVWDEEARVALADGDGDWRPLEDVCDATRLTSLIDGTAEPTDQELLHVARAYVEAGQTDDDLADSFAGTYPFTLLGSDGREAWVYLYVSGYSFTGVDYELDGPYLSEDDCLEARQARGFCPADEVTLDAIAVMRGGDAA